MRKLGLLVTVLSAGLGTAALAADFDGDSRSDPAIFRAGTGLWSAPGITRFYFGATGDSIAPGDYNGDGIDEAAIFRPSSSMWSVRNVTRAYLGAAGDVPVTGGGGLRTYDYVVRAGDGADLVRALEGTYQSVYVPQGDYSVSEVINVASVRRITGENNNASIILVGNSYLSIGNHYCLVEGIRVSYGGNSSTDRGSIYISADGVTVRDCRVWYGGHHGFHYAATAENPRFINCEAMGCATGFKSASSANGTELITACLALDCGVGFSGCSNLSNCYAENSTYYGFTVCSSLSACRVLDTDGTCFFQCWFLSSCRADGSGNAARGFGDCDYISSSFAVNCIVGWDICGKVDSDSCNN